MSPSHPQVRNEALSPLYSGALGRFDRVIFLNDVFFCMHDTLRLIMLNQVRKVCTREPQT